MWMVQIRYVGYNLSSALVHGFGLVMVAKLTASPVLETLVLIWHGLSKHWTMWSLRIYSAMVCPLVTKAN